MAGRLLAELSGPAAASALGPDSIVVVPTGSVEHHGPHLPLLTDYLLADLIGTPAVTRAAADGVDVWQLPTLAYTKSDEHHWALGTVWLSWETLMRTVVEIGDAVARAGAGKLVFLNGHGGNVALLQVALREIRRRTGLATFLMPSLVRAPAPAGEDADEHGMSIHGGAAETSIILHLRPDLVDLALAKRSVPEHIAAMERIGFNGKPVSFGWLSDDFGPSGVIGDPTGASDEFGRVLFETSVATAAATLADIAAFTHLPPSG